MQVARRRRILGGFAILKCIFVKEISYFESPNSQKISACGGLRAPNQYKVINMFFFQEVPFPFLNSITCDFPKSGEGNSLGDATIFINFG